MKASRKIAVTSAGITDIGKKRKMNQDSLLFDDAMGLYIVADGMGGHLGGEVASRMVIDTMLKCFSSPDSMDDNAIPFPERDTSLSRAAGRLVRSIEHANAAVFKKGSEDSNLRGMGSTVAAVYLTDETLVAANVGDSPVYLVRDRSIELLSVPHTVASEMPGQSAFSGAKHLLTRSVGIAETVEVDSCEIQYFNNDTIVLCSDGLSNLVSMDEIRDRVEKDPPDLACRNLVELANGRGGFDNITVIVVEFRTAGAGRTAAKGIIAGIMRRLRFKKFT